jgi:hypothetical protein
VGMVILLGGFAAPGGVGGSINQTGSREGAKSAKSLQCASQHQAERQDH